jgi:hypothetical protein
MQHAVPGDQGVHEALVLGLEVSMPSSRTPQMPR